MSLEQLLLEPLQYGFMQRAFIGVLLVGFLSGALGAFVVTRGLAFLGDALAHSVLPGVAVVFLAGGGSNQAALMLGGMVAAVVSAIGIGLISRGRGLREDTATGIVFVGMLALGIALISASRNFATDLQHILVGDILAVSASDLSLIAAISAGVLLLLLLFYKELLVTSFDPILAQTLRLPRETLRIGLIVLLAVTVVVAVQVAGVLMSTALLITPAATMRLYLRRLHTLMLGAGLLAGACGILGMYLAWHLNIAASAAIVLTMIAFFLASFLFAPHRGYVWQRLGKAAA